MRGAEKSAPLQRFLTTLRFRRPPKDLADRIAARYRQAKADDGFVRETFTQPRDQARESARGFLDQWPAAAHMSVVESCRELPGGEIEFTMRRLWSADRSGSLWPTFAA